MSHKHKQGNESANEAAGDREGSETESETDQDDGLGHAAQPPRAGEQDDG